MGRGICVGHYLLVAGVAFVGAGASASTNDTSADTSENISEIVVTAQKRAERIQDVPVPVTALPADQLVDRNELRLQDYYTSVPGLSLVSGGQGDVNLTIRGISTGGSTNPTVGITVDDVPYGSTSALGSISAPDIDPSDLAQVEVLRGPQGTLYGASSIGGLVKYVTVDPSTEALSGRVQADISGVHNGDSPGYGVRAAVNVPVSDAFAIRASGFTRRDAGYVDDPVQHINGINQIDVDGGRLAALWRPSDVFSVKLNAFFQKTRGNGLSSVSTDASLRPLFGDLQQSALAGTGGFTQDINVYSAVIKARLGSTELTAISGYSINKYATLSDFPAYDFASDAIFPGVDGNSLYFNYRTKKFSQEVRWSSLGQQTFEWMLGGFYTREASYTVDVDRAVDPATGASSGVLFTDPYPTTYTEYAVFGDLTWHVTDKFDVQTGARETQNKQTYYEIISGPIDDLFFGMPSPVIIPPVDTKDNAFTYLVTPRFKLTPDMMIYARLASGYRPGGPNPTSTLFGFPTHYGADKTQNYEVGFKGSALDRLISFDASIYYIDWKDIQLQTLTSQNAVYYINASRAKSEGVELSAQLNPVKGLTIAGWVAFNNAVLTSDLPSGSPVAGVAGDRLPYGSRFSGNLSVDDEFRLAGSATGFVGGSVGYVSVRDNIFAATEDTRMSFPSYAKVDLRTGVKYEKWMASVFVNNATDRRGVLSTNPAGANFLTNYIQPRTAGLSLAYTF